jgi:hypothetical protein
VNVKENLKEWVWWAIPVVVALGVGIALYYGRKQQSPEPQEQVQAPPAPPPSTEPAIKNPLTPAEPAKPLPGLNDSDPELRDSLGSLFGRALDQYLVPENIVRNVVVTVDNLPRKKLNVQRAPLKPTPGEFAARGQDQFTLNPDNYARYAPMIKLVQNADAKQIADLYRRYYPLFQQAYVDLGYPDGYFNDRLVEVIDHLLETPDVQGPIALTQPGVFYEFVDPALEARSAGQKALLRMGSENAATVKAKLRELRREVSKDQGP